MNQLLTKLAPLATGVFFVMALRRVYQEPWKMMLRRLIVFSVVGTVSFLVMTVGLGGLAIWVYGALRASK